MNTGCPDSDTVGRSVTMQSISSSLRYQDKLANLNFSIGLFVLNLQYFISTHNPLHLPCQLYFGLITIIYKEVGKNSYKKRQSWLLHRETMNPRDIMTS